MQPVCLISLGDETFSGHIIGEYLAETDPAYTPNLDVMYFNQHWGSNDANCHRHSQEEYIFVLQGQIDQLVNHQFVSTGPGQLTCIRAGVPHKIIHVQAPVVNFLFHVPGGKIERVYYPDCADGPEEGIRPEKSVFQVDMRRDFQSHLDYRSFSRGRLPAGRSSQLLALFGFYLRLGSGPRRSGSRQNASGAFRSGRILFCAARTAGF